MHLASQLLNHLSSSIEVGASSETEAMQPRTARPISLQGGQQRRRTADEDCAVSSRDMQDPLLEMLEHLGVGVVILDDGGHAIALNSVASSMLGSEMEVRGCADEREWAGRCLNRLMTRARGRVKSDKGACFTIARDEKRDLVLQTMRIAPDHRLVLMIDLDNAALPKPDLLQRMFGLTMAESRLAIQIAQGACPAEIARNNGVSVATVRSQLASVFAKTETGRQLELASLMSRLALLS